MTSIVLVSPGLGQPHPLTFPSGNSGEVILRVGWAGRVSPWTRPLGPDTLWTP